jgi:hypothetical protein
LPIGWTYVVERRLVTQHNFLSLSEDDGDDAREQQQGEVGRCTASWTSARVDRGWSTQWEVCGRGRSDELHVHGFKAPVTDAPWRPSPTLVWNSGAGAVEAALRCGTDRKIYALRCVTQSQAHAHIRSR